MKRKDRSRPAKLLLAAVILLSISGNNPLMNFYFSTASHIYGRISHESNNENSYLSQRIKESEGHEFTDYTEISSYEKNEEDTQTNSMIPQDYSKAVKFIDNDLYSVSASVMADGCIDDDLSIRVSELNDYFMDDRKGRLVDFYACGEMVYDGLYYGIVNRYAIEGPVLDFTYSPERETEWFSVYFDIEKEGCSPEDYEIYKAVAVPEAEDGTMMLIPYETFCEKEFNRVYTVDDINETGKVTYALINKNKLHEFHKNVNGSAPNDSSSQAALDSLFYKYEFRFRTDPDFSAYSDTEDDDGDGITDRMEMYLGTDPGSPVTRGVSDSDIRFIHKADQKITEAVSNSNSKFDFYVETVSSSDINNRLTVNVSSLSDTFRNDMNGRLVNTKDTEGNSVDVIYGSILNPSAIEGDIIDVSFDSTEGIDMIRAAFVFPEGTPEEELRNYIIAASKYGEEPYMTTNNDVIRYEGNTIYYPYLRDVKSFALVDMRKLKQFTEENNGLSLEEERLLRIYPQSYFEYIPYSVYHK